MNCSICNHESHEPGKCEQRNCGEDEICHSNAIDTDYTRVVTWENFSKGQVSARDVTHIKRRNTGNA